MFIFSCVLEFVCSDIFITFQIKIDLQRCANMLSTLLAVMTCFLGRFWKISLCLILIVIMYYPMEAMLCLFEFASICWHLCSDCSKHSPCVCKDTKLELVQVFGSSLTGTVARGDSTCSRALSGEQR